jgi:hypothetical protein
MSDPNLTVSEAITELVRSTGSAARQRELRAALSHVDAGLGTMPIRNLRSRHVAALLDDLREAGLSPRREDAIVDAVDSLSDFVADAPAAPSRPATAPTPTLTMLTLGARVAVWTTWAIMIAFALLLLALVLELR